MVSGDLLNDNGDTGEAFFTRRQHVVLKKYLKCEIFLFHSFINNLYNKTGFSELYCEYSYTKYYCYMYWRQNILYILISLKKIILCHFHFCPFWIEVMKNGAKYNQYKKYLKKQSRNNCFCFEDADLCWRLVWRYKLFSRVACCVNICINSFPVKNCTAKESHNWLQALHQMLSYSVIVLVTKGFLLCWK